MLVFFREAFEFFAVSFEACANVQELCLRDENSKNRLKKCGVEIEGDMDQRVRPILFTFLATAIHLDQ